MSPSTLYSARPEERCAPGPSTSPLAPPLAGEPVVFPAPAPASLAQAYTRFLIHNAPAVASVESTVRSATYLLPGRFEGAEIASEGVFSLLTLLHSLHSTLLQAHLASLPTSLRPSLPPPTTHDRYTRSWSRYSLVYKLASSALVGVGGVQLLGEMIALKGIRGNGSGKDGKKNWERRWKWLVGMEGTKTLLRLLLLLLTCRPLLHPLLPTTSLDPAQFAPSPPSTPPSPSSRPKDPLKEILLPKTLYANSLTAPRDLVGRLSSRGMVGEALYAMRGLVYVLMLKSRSTSLPVLLSLLIALVSRTLLRAERKREGQGRGGVSGLEKEEFARRDRALGGLLFRGVLWEGLTKPALESVVRKTQRIPLVGLVGGLLSDYVPLIDEYYYYTEA